MDLETCKNNNQEKLLLNALKNKFEATETASFSPPKFAIPRLRIPEATTFENFNRPNKITNTQTILPSTPDSQLNQFILKQLQEKHTSGGLSKNTSGFVLPQLQSSTDNNKIAVKFELPVLKPEAARIHRDNLPTATKHSNPSTIDLTTALSIKTHQGTPPTRDLIKPQQNSVEFEIPFIDCDRLDVSRKHKKMLPTSNEYCITDISRLLLQHSLAEPSAIGRFLSIDNKYLAPLPLKCLAPEYRQQSVKHYIEPFSFETKSPDDVVLLALNKYQRRHYN